MHTVSAVVDGAGSVRVVLHSGQHTVGAPLPSQTETTEPDEGPSPITPEAKELWWSLGAFLVLLVAMRLYLVPKLKEGMQRRYGKVRADLEHAEEVRDAARQDVAQYEAQLVAVRSEAAARIEAARQVLDRERTERFTEANAGIAGRRAAAAADAESAMLAAQSTVEEAASSVAARVVELSTGRRPDDAAVRGAVADLMGRGART